MGWISDRHMRSGGSIGPGGLSERKRGAPLRKIVRIIRRSDSIFATAQVELECGHEAESWGGVRARCVKCKEVTATKTRKAVALELELTAPPCERCGPPVVGKHEHPCPFRQDVDGDSKTLCTCCEACESSCREDI